MTRKRIHSAQGELHPLSCKLYPKSKVPAARLCVCSGTKSSERLVSPPGPFTCHSVDSEFCGSEKTLPV